MHNYTLRFYQFDTITCPYNVIINVITITQESNHILIEYFR